MLNKATNSRINRFICLLYHAYEMLLANKMERQRWPEKLLIRGRSGTQYVAMVTELLSSYCRACTAKNQTFVIQIG